MQKCNGKIFAKPLYLETKDFKNIKDIIINNRETFIDYIHKIGLHVSYNSTTTNMKNSSTTILTLKTTCFKVDFNDNLVKISPLK
jgi:hypothetical protein